ncbi:FG-GAP repeat protein [Sphaerisporangium corydalis]|uniref:VCBS repeat-containing protein n=1 Tax=Sphaerisporangium corydalis TaxID=1441875 RepID=A0ABV9EV73_9ACTN|nr:FG-GAP repeat protein [Sphaerisporangium corydalis]
MRRLLLALAILAGTLTTAPAHEATTPHGSQTSAPGDCANAGTADFDGDGRNDVVAGDPFGDPPGTWAGGGHLFFLRGTANGFPEVSGAPFDRVGGLGGWVARAGHIDGDRCLDLVVASPYWTGQVTEGAGGRATPVPGAGDAYIYWGGRDFGRANAGRIELRAPEQRNGAHFGWSLAVSPGAVAVGAPYEDGDGIPDSGAVYVYAFGGPDGRRPAPPRRFTQQTPGVPGDGEAGDLFGWSVALGSLGAGPAQDLAVGAPYEDRGVGGAPTPDSGAVTVVYDALAGQGTFYRGDGWDLSELAGGTLTAKAGDLFGYSLAYGQDGTSAYLAAGAPHADAAGQRDAGAVQLITGGRAGGGLRPAGILVQGAGGMADTSEPGDQFGFSLAFSGPDLVVGAPFDGDGTRPETGAVHVIALSATGAQTGRPPGSPAPVPAAGRLVRASGAQTYDHFGWAVSGAGDGWLVVGVPDRNRTGAAALVPPRDGPVRMLAPGDGRVALFGRTEHGATQGVDFGAAVAG